MRKKLTIFSSGLAAGTAIGASGEHSWTVFWIGLAVAYGPWVAVGIAHVAIKIHRSMWADIRNWRAFAPPELVRPHELDGFEYQHMYDTGELPERWVRYERAKEARKQMLGN